MTGNLKALAAVMGASVLAAWSPCPAGTAVGGFISEDTTWSLSGSPYVVQSSLAVIGGATLTIEPGVEVRVDPGLVVVVDTGALVARGTPWEPIVFTANQGTQDDQRWGYLQFSDNAADATFDEGGAYISGSILENAVVEWAGQTNLRGAVRAISSSPYIHATTIRSNSRGGLYADNAYEIRIDGNTITQNMSAGHSLDSAGAGVCLDNCFSPMVVGNTITQNDSGYSGGGVRLYYCEDSTLSGNTIGGNSAYFKGGGVDIVHCLFTTLSDNAITENNADQGAGVELYFSLGLYCYANTIAGNTAESRGGGIHSVHSEEGILSGDRIVGNHAPAGGGIYLDGENHMWMLYDLDDLSVFAQIYANDAEQVYNDNDFSGSFDYWDPGNVDARNVWWGTTDSAAIEAGIYDFLDDPSKGVVFYSPCAAPLVGDASLDGVVNIQDLSILATNWEKQPSFWDEGDFNGDAEVNIQDLSMLATNWGAEAAAVPEPACLVLLLAGAGTLIGRRR